MTELERAWDEAWSLENMEAHGDILPVTPIGEIDKGSHIYQFYRDTAGKYWYKVKLRQEDGQVIDRGSLFSRTRKKYTARQVAPVQRIGGKDEATEETDITAEKADSRRRPKVEELAGSR